jgi:hypothetical protein
MLMDADTGADMDGELGAKTGFGDDFVRNEHVADRHFSGAATHVFTNFASHFMAFTKKGMFFHRETFHVMAVSGLGRTTRT